MIGRRYVHWGVAWMALMGCGGDPGESTGGGGASTDGQGGGGNTTATTSSGEQGGAGGTAPCLENPIPLELTISADGVADSQVIPVRYQGADAYLAVDTGSPYTFVFGPEGAPVFEEHVGDVQVGCELFPVDQITLEALEPEPFNGKLIIGIVGMNFFSEVPTELDYPGGRVVRHLDGAAPERGLTAVPIAWNGDRVIVDAALEGEAVRLIYDAGSPHTVWVGQPGEPGDEMLELLTADGETTTVYEGTAALTFADDGDVNVPVWRAPEFPYLEEELVELDADGLLGATGLGFRRVVFDLGRDRLWLGPRVSHAR